MPLTTRTYARIKQNLKFWHLVDREGTDHDALWDLFVECRTALDLMIDAQEENAPPSFFDRLRGLFGH